MREKSKKIMWIASVIFLLISFAVLYLTNRAVPFMMDDLWYSTLLSEDTPITSFGDIVRSQIWHYNNWGGRTMTHSILQLTLLAGEQVADILNIVMTALLSWMICVCIGERRLPVFFAAMAMLIGLNANWKMSMFWQAGAANYLYITVFVLGFLYCYLRELPKDEQALESGAASDRGKETAESRLPGITLWIFPLGILAGWSNENMGPTVWVLSLLVILYLHSNHRKISAWMIIGNLSCLAGSILMIVAPGNFVRSSQVVENEYGLLWNIFLRCYAESKAALEYLFPVLLLLSVLLLISKGILKQTIGARNLLLLTGALLSWGAMILSPHYPDRATFGTMVFLICVILSLMKNILRERRDLRWMFFAINVLIWLRGMYFLGEFLGISWGWIK